MSSYGAVVKTPPPEGDQNRGEALLAVISSSLSLVVVTLLLRMYARSIIVSSTGWDDYTIIASTVRFWSWSLKWSFCIDEHTGTCYSQRSIKSQICGSRWRKTFLLLGTSASDRGDQMEHRRAASYILTSCLTKVSICLMIIRLTNSRRMTQAMWTFVVFLVVINLACFIVFTASCEPFKHCGTFPFMASVGAMLFCSHLLGYKVVSLIHRSVCKGLTLCAKGFQ